MTVSEIIKAVRWCIDEESNNISDMAEVIDEKDDLYMDNIIKAKINDALHWLAVTASSSEVFADSEKTGTTTSKLSVSSFDTERNIGVVSMPTDVEIINIFRIRGEGWFKAITPVEDTDDKALMMFDDTAQGTLDRPQATIMRETPLRILMQPMTEQATVTYVGVPKSVDTDDDTDVNVPDKLRNAFIYYIAFLLLSAYDDTKANQMFTIALQQLGANTSSK